MSDYPIVPGRGLVTPSSLKMRLEYLEEKGIDVDLVRQSGLSIHDVQNKIESLIGSIEIPVGLLGPLRVNFQTGEEWIHTAGATLEGALIASMNRGAKAASMSGGVSTKFVHQRMMRCPMFEFEEEGQTTEFVHWLEQNFDLIKKESESHSNHAELIELDPVIIGRTVHVRFYYSTGDASGQNMTTTCTWHAILMIADKFHTDTNIEPRKFIIEGNGSSDKKVSRLSSDEGRGVHVIAECILEESVINKVLRTTSNDLLDCYYPSRELAKKDGMFGYSINAANAIAALFAATGQDLACVHESSVANLYLEKCDRGLLFRLTLPCLVIGTVGGGTSMPKQKQILEMMGCSGQGKLRRFAQIIAGFALSLEISTYAAIVSGEFAKAHEKLGRNKPIRWLTKSELNEKFVNDILKKENPNYEPLTVQFQQMELENGIITNLTGRLNNKLLGFFPFQAIEGNDTNQYILKSKAVDLDVIKGLHAMAASIDPQLSDLIYKNRNATEYKNCHLKEIYVYRELNKCKFDYMPRFLGALENEDREIFVLIMEFLDPQGMKLFNSENSPEKWSEQDVIKMIQAITIVHKHFHENFGQVSPLISAFSPSNSEDLYRKLIDIIIQEEEDSIRKDKLVRLHDYLEEMKVMDVSNLPQTLIHNDFNPRNAGIRNNNVPCIYDWELSVINIPHRDVIEFLSFVMTDSTSILELLKGHASSWNRDLDENWLLGYEYALKEFLVCRMTFYKASEILMKLKFPDRVIDNAFLLLDLMSEYKSRVFTLEQ